MDGWIRRQADLHIDRQQHKHRHAGTTHAEADTRPWASAAGWRAPSSSAAAQRGTPKSHAMFSRELWKGRAASGLGSRARWCFGDALLIEG